MLGNGSLNAVATVAHATMEEPLGAVLSKRSDARQTVTLQWNTSHYVTHISRVTARSVLCGVLPEAI
jgi:hypothetical protein